MGLPTKKDGHGFGLHSSVLAAREMGGDLLGHSDGINRGARFQLRVPTAKVQDEVLTSNIQEETGPQAIM